MSTLELAVAELAYPPARHSQFDLSSASQQLGVFPVLFMGWSFKNASSSATATLTIYDATGAGGAGEFPVQLAADESSREWFGPMGVLFQSGIFVDVTAGQVKGSVFYVPLL